MRSSQLNWAAAVALGIGVAVIPAARATDHDNLEAGQPLQVQDAETIALGALEWSVAGNHNRSRGRHHTGMTAEMAYGFARNWQLNVAVEPGYTRNGGRGEWSLGSTEIGVAHNLRRETEGGPALGYLVELGLPTGRGEQGTVWRWRGLASRQTGRYGRLHANLDLGWHSHSEPGERSIEPAVWLGYSRPLGLPRHFDTTLVAQAGLRASRQSGGKSLANVGVGLRRQITPRAVLSAGVSADVTGEGTEKEKMRLTVGYTSTF